MKKLFESVDRLLKNENEPCSGSKDRQYAFESFFDDAVNASHDDFTDSNPDDNAFRIRARLIEDTVRRSERESAFNQIYTALSKLGLDRRKCGTRLIAQAVYIKAENPQMNMSSIYDKLSESSGKSIKNVQNLCRYACESAIEKGFLLDFAVTDTKRRGTSAKKGLAFGETVRMLVFDTALGIFGEFSELEDAAENVYDPEEIFF